MVRWSHRNVSVLNLLNPALQKGSEGPSNVYCLQQKIRTPLYQQAEATGPGPQILPQIHTASWRHGTF